MFIKMKPTASDDLIRFALVISPAGKVLSSTESRSRAAWFDEDVAKKCQMYYAAAERLADPAPPPFSVALVDSL